MKLKQFFYWLGYRPKTKTFGCEIDTYAIPGFGEVKYANWLHPKMGKFVIRQEMVAAFKSILSPGDTALDIGAHAGDTAVVMGLAVGPVGTVFALEPNKYVYETLLTNSQLNPNLVNIVPFNFAASDEDGPLFFQYSDSGFCNGGHFEYTPAHKHAHFFELEVQGKNVVRFLQEKYPEQLQKLKYIKIDAEGSDFFIAKTLEPIIQVYRPYIKTEINRHMPKNTREDYFAFLTRFEYSLQTCDQWGGPNGEPFDVTKGMDNKHYDMWAIPLQV